jgi:hypothetical protein
MTVRAEGDDGGNRQSGRAVRWIDGRLPVVTLLNRELNEFRTCGHSLFTGNDPEPSKHP